jgi:DNA gyrase subunit B
MSDSGPAPGTPLREVVRMRPGMYVGDTTGDGAIDGLNGLMVMLLEVLGNALDQHLLARCTAIHVEVDDDVVTVRDDGPGLPLDTEAGLAYLTTRHRTPTADGHAPHVHLGAGGGLGLAPINALSARFDVDVVRGGLRFQVGYEQGLVVEPLTSAPSDLPTGTTIRFRPDPAIFRTTTRISRGALTERLELLTFLVPTLRLTWSFGADSAARRGLAGLIAQRLVDPLGPIAHRAARIGDIDVEVAISWRRVGQYGDREPRITSICNLGITDQDGTHVEGLLDGIASLWHGQRRRARRALQHGLVAAVAVVLADVRFGQPMKSELLTEDARPAVATVARDVLATWAASNPDALAAVLAQAAEAPARRR